MYCGFPGTTIKKWEKGPLHRFLFKEMITKYWSVARQAPFGAIGGVLLLLVFTVLASPFAPARCICTMPVVESISEP